MESPERTQMLLAGQLAVEVYLDRDCLLDVDLVAPPGAEPPVLTGSLT